MKKLIAFIYGVFAYLLFLIAFLYAIGFAGDFLVPKSINSGTETGFMDAFLVNITLLSIFAVTTTPYILFDIHFLEERDLQKMHRETYVEYQKKVQMLIPFFRRGN